MDHSVSKALKPPEWMRRGEGFQLLPGQESQRDVSRTHVTL